MKRSGQKLQSPRSPIGMAGYERILLSFRMISDTRIECRNANSSGETAGVGPIGSDRGGVEPGSAGAVELDGFLRSLRQRDSHLPPLRHQPTDVLSLAAPL